jgi:hypothetical protein
VGFGPGDFTHSTLHAVNLSSGEDRVIGRFGNSSADVIGPARISAAGVVYSSSRVDDNGTLVSCRGRGSQRRSARDAAERAPA